MVTIGLTYISLVLLSPALGVVGDSSARNQVHEASPGFNGEDRLYFTLAGLRVRDSERRTMVGFRVGGGLWDEYSSDSGGRVMYFLSSASGDGQRETSAGVNIGGLMLPKGPFRAFPFFSVGASHRSTSPAAGLEAFFGVGAEFMTWLTKKFQVAATVERDFGSRSDPSTRLSLEFRWSPKNTVPEKPANYTLQRTVGVGLDAGFSRSLAHRR